MLIEKLEWVRHVTLRDERAPIYSIDLHPDGTRFATGAGDSKIKIWSTKSLLEDGSGSEASGDEAEGPSPAGNGANGEAAIAAKDLMASRMAGPKSTAKTQDSPQLLAVLASHTDPVNCVRWSSKGRFLASASDDRFIIIWEQRAAGMPSSAPFGSEAVKNVENWGQAYTLQGHSLNIMDINWSPDDTMLASASLDNRVLIWPMRAALSGEKGVAIQPLMALDGHGNQVKGVAWDPVGKYLATSAQDNTLMVWRTSDWEVQARVAKPFQETAKQESLFRRISWSPDGGSICATNASKKSRHVAALLSRGNEWASDTDLVGHERPVVATRFCPTIFRKKDTASGGQKHSTLVALGDDNSGLLTIWSSVRSRPLLVVKDVFAGGTTDLTWSRDGRLLLASSLDGTVCMLSFDQGELGAGKPLAPAEMAALFMRTYGSGASEGTVLREHALMAKATNSKAPNQEPSSPSAFTGSSPMASPAAPAPPASSSSSGGMTTNWLQPRPKDGKKRIRPQLLGSTSGSLSGGPDSQAGLASPATTKRLRPLGAPVSLAHVAGPRTVVSVVVEKESVSFTVDCPYDKAGVLTRILNDFDGLGGHVDELMAMDDDSGFGGPSRRLPVTVDVTITERPGVGHGPSLGPISHVKVSTNGEVVWKEALPGRAKCVCGNGALVGVGCSDGSVHLLQGNSGLRLCPPLMMGAPVALLECTPAPTPAAAAPGDGPKPSLAMHVMGVDQLGGLRVWDTYAMRSIVHTSVKPLFTSLAADAPPPKAPSASLTPAPKAPVAAPVAKIVRAEVGVNGRPRLEVASGGKGGAVQAFVFDGALDSWMRVHDSRYVLSDFASSASGYGGAGVLAVSTLLREEEDKAVQREVTRGHLEERLASAVAAGGKADVTYYLRLLVTRLSKAGQVGRLRALCDRLMGRLGTSEGEDEQEPSEATPSNLAYWRPDQKWLVPGELSKREALTSLVLPIMSEAMDSAAIQRLVKHCHEALKDATST